MLVLLKARLAAAWPPVIRPSYSFTEMANSFMSYQGQCDKDRKTQPYYTPFHFGNEHHEVNGSFKCWDSPSWSINFPISQKMKVHRRTHNSSRLVLILNWINPVNIPTFYWFKIRFNIFLQCKNTSSEWYVTFPSAFPTKILAHIFRTKTLD